MRNKEEIKEKLNELLKAKEKLEINNEFRIRNIDEFNMAIRVLKWVLDGED
ncbi:MAG: hypothetical protein QXD89_02845 [Candidatus Aenigmatarchaeota archaeon]